jgi:hypothetical protein
MIGSIRRDCLDHVVIFGEQHLHHLLNSYQEYYNESRTHLSLKKDAPIPRHAQRRRTRARPVNLGWPSPSVRAGLNIRQGTRDAARDAEDVRDHVARDQRAVEHQIDQRWQLGVRAPPLQLALEQMSPREPPIVALVHSAPRGSCSTTRGSHCRAIAAQALRRGRPNRGSDFVDCWFYITIRGRKTPMDILTIRPMNMKLVLPRAAPSALAGPGRLG